MPDMLGSLMPEVVLQITPRQNNDIKQKVSESTQEPPLTRFLSLAQTSVTGPFV